MTKDEKVQFLNLLKKYLSVDEEVIMVVNDAIDKNENKETHKNKCDYCNNCFTHKPIEKEELKEQHYDNRRYNSTAAAIIDINEMGYRMADAF